MINSGHHLVKLSKAVDWKRLEEMFGETTVPIMAVPPSAPSYGSPFNFFIGKVYDRVKTALPQNQLRFSLTV